MEYLKDVFSKIDQISKLGGSKIKVQALKEADSPLLRDVIVWTYDPLITFGVKKLPAPTKRATTTETLEVFQMLDDLRDRSLSGKRAQIELAELMGGLCFSERLLLERIIKRDLRWGLNAKSINKAIPGLVREFSAMLAHKYEAKRIKKWPAAAEEKLDGVRVLAVVDIADRRCKFLSRSGKPFTSFDHLTPYLFEAIAHYSTGKPSLDYLAGHNGDGLCGELVIDGEVTSGSFLETVSSVRKKDQAAEEAVFHVFDILTQDEFFKQKESRFDYKARRDFLQESSRRIEESTQGKVVIVPSWPVYNQADIDKSAAEVMDAGGEGLIIKPYEGHYECKRSFFWLKIKAENDETLRIVDAYEGEGKYVGMLGGVIVQRGKVQVRVGGGFTDEERVGLWRDYQLDQQEPEVLRADETGRLLNRLIDVEYHEVTPEGSLRHSRFLRFRDDRETGDFE